MGCAGSSEAKPAAEGKHTGHLLDNFMGAAQHGDLQAVQIALNRGVMPEAVDSVRELVPGVGPGHTAAGRLRLPFRFLCGSDCARAADGGNRPTQSGGRRPLGHRQDSPREGLSCEDALATPLHPDVPEVARGAMGKVNCWGKSDSLIRRTHARPHVQLETENSDGETPLYMAARYGKTTVRASQMSRNDHCSFAFPGELWRLHPPREPMASCTAVLRGNTFVVSMLLAWRRRTVCMPN